MSMTQAPSLGTQSPPKEMLSITRDPAGRPLVRINFSSLDVIQTCKRKAHYLLDRKLKNNVEASATLFGSAIHKGLEAWYLRPIAERRPASPKCDGEIPGGKCSCPRCDTIRGFLSKAEPLYNLDLSDKRHPSSGIRILDDYIRKFLDDPFEVLQDAAGRPMVECTLEAVISDTPAAQITLFGTIDVILRNVQYDTILVTDHKTTSSLGVEFYKRIKPNHQYTGYILLVKEALGLAVEGFLVNGIQVAKTKTAFARQFTHRDEADFAELRAALVAGVTEYLACKVTGIWPQSAPNPCSMYGGCAYHSICEVNPVLREQVIKSLYRNLESEPALGHPVLSET